jgi:1-acyl-sn-glycerol-3-phosphate acyltransferase
MKWFWILLRLPLVLLYSLTGFFIIILLHVLAGKRWFQRNSGKHIIRLWMKLLAWLMGLRVHVRGQPGQGLLAANHISWLDIIALDTVIAARFVSKDDILSWPLIGLLPKWSGTFFLQRGSAAAVGRLNAEIVEALQHQDTVAVFPEGTTHNGEQVHRFFSAILQTGIDAGVPVQAVAIRYLRNGERDTLAPFIDDEGFAENVVRVLGAGRIDVYLDFCEAFVPHDMNRRQLSEHLYHQVKDTFSRPVE